MKRANKNWFYRKREDRFITYTKLDEIKKLMLVWQTKESSKNNDDDTEIKPQKKT